MNLESFNRVTQIKIHGLDMYDYQRVVSFLEAAIGGVVLNYVGSLDFDSDGFDSRFNGVKFGWNHFDMAEHLNKPSVSEVLAEQIALIPEAAPEYLELIDHIIDDWQTFDRTVEHGQPESCAQVIEMLAKKRAEIRENLREEPYLNASVDVAKGRFSESVAEWESSAKASQRRLERSQ
ncbi:hypothetical protein J7937_21760 [Vibrio parahaemolyticus]|nr:hypothetical protein [Vibrio parahaemolyticus]MCF9079971.1 hypothetical protein [Vibrio parahaemolyticus]